MGVVAWQLGAVPLLWLVVRRHRAVAHWWLAAAFGVAWVADATVFLGWPWRVVSLAYPLSQAALVGAVFLTRRAAMQVAAWLVCVGLLAPLAPMPDVLLHTAAWGSIVAIVWRLWAIGMLRTALLWYFGLGLLAWYGYVGAPAWPTWVTYQVVRLVGVILYCRAVGQRPVRLA